MTQPIGQRKRLNTTHQALDGIVSYPSQWFEDHPGKPPITVIPGTDAISQNVRTTVLEQLHQGTLNHRTVVAFLMQEFRNKPMQSMTPWSSFGRVICAQNEMCSISDLYFMEEIEAPADYVQGAQMHNDQVLRYLIIICTLYRMAHFTDVEYLGNIALAANRLLEGRRYAPFEFANHLESYRNWHKLTYCFLK